MASTTTPVIGLFKPVPGTAEPFRVADLNTNMDKLDAAYGTIGPKIVEADEVIQEVEAALTSIETKETELDSYLLQASNEVNAFEDASADALTAFETESAAALAAIDADQILIDLENEIDTRLDAVEASLLAAFEDGFTVDGGTA